MIKVTFNSKSYKKGEDETGLFKINVMNILFNQRNAYFYTIYHYSPQSLCLGNFEKTNFEGNRSIIWEHIFSLDNKNCLCLNDVYDKYEESGTKPIKADKVIIDFLEKLEKNLTIISKILPKKINDKEQLIQAILHISITDKKFFDKYIDIDNASLNKIFPKLYKTPAIVLYEKEKITSALSVCNKNQTTVSKI